MPNLHAEPASAAAVAVAAASAAPVQIVSPLAAAAIYFAGVSPLWPIWIQGVMPVFKLFLSFPFCFGHDFGSPRSTSAHLVWLNGGIGFDCFEHAQVLSGWLLAKVAFAFLWARKHASCLRFLNKNSAR